MIKSIKNYLRWRKFKKKVLTFLPRYSEYHGGKLTWKVTIKSKNRFDPNTGEKIPVGLSVLEIINGDWRNGYIVYRAHLNSHILYLTDNR